MNEQFMRELMSGISCLSEKDLALIMQCSTEKGMGNVVNQQIQSDIDRLCKGKALNDKYDCPCGKIVVLKNRTKHEQTKHHIKECTYD